MNSTNQKTVVFSSLPKNIGELKELPQSSLTDPFEVAALTVAALCRYCDSRDDCVEMLTS